MKVVFVTTSFIRSSTDYYSYFIYEQAESLALENGEAKVTVLAPHTPGCAARENIGLLRVVRFPYFFPFRLQRLAYQTDGLFKTMARSPLALLQLPLFLMSMFVHIFIYGRNAQIIHAQWIPTAFVALPLKLFWKVKIVVSVRGSDLHGINKPGFKQNVYRLLLNRLDAILPVSKDFHRILQNEMKVTAPITPLFNGVNTTHFRRHASDVAKASFGLKNGEPLFLYVGNLVLHKGVDTLLKAFADVLKLHPTARLLLAGEGPELQRFTDIALELGITSQIKFLGLVERENVPMLMSAAEVLVLPSLGEGRPNVVLEAMACESLVIATGVGGTKELIDHTKTGFLFTPGDVQKLAEHMNFALSHPDQARALARDARASLTEKELTWETHGEKLNKVYRSLVPN